MSFEVRQRADEKGPGEEEFNKLAHSVDEFTSSLLNPLKSNAENRQIFADSLDDVMENAIEFEQKKVKEPDGTLTLGEAHSLIPPPWYKGWWSPPPSWDDTSGEG